MPRIIWLNYEKSPHPEAVSHPANEDDARIVLELLGRPPAERLRIAERFRDFVKRQKTLPLFCRETIPCRRQTGLYYLIPWRLAKWLSHVLRTTNPILQRTMSRLQVWLDVRSRSVSVVSAKPTGCGSWDETQVFAQPMSH
jgi:hypothetical protein